MDNSEKLNNQNCMHEESKYASLAQNFFNNPAENRYYSVPAYGTEFIDYGNQTNMYNQPYFVQSHPSKDEMEMNTQTNQYINSELKYYCTCDLQKSMKDYVSDQNDMLKTFSTNNDFKDHRKNSMLSTGLNQINKLLVKGYDYQTDVRTKSDGKTYTVYI